MINPMFSLACLLLVLMHNADGTLRMAVNPTNFTLGLSESLTVNCSFSFAEISNISGIITLIVSKSDQQEQFIDIVSVNVFAPDEITTFSQVDGQVSGHIDQDHESYLSIVLPSPNDNDTGLYRCEVNGVDNHGHPSELFQTSLVTSQQPSMDQLKDKIRQLQKKLQLQSLLCEVSNEFNISSEYNGHYYLLSKQSWTDSTVSAKICKDYGGYLAQINNNNENQFVKDFLDQHTGFDVVLISGTDSQHKGRWTYTDTDTDLVFYDWYPGDPDGGQSQNCIVMYRGYQWRWWDNSCAHSFTSYKFLCEFEIV